MNIIRVSRILSIVFLTFIGLNSVNGQIKDPVKWSTRVEKIGEKDYKLILTATLDKDWNIYSQYLQSEDGPQKTMLKFDKSNAQLKGKIEEVGKKKEGYDEMFAMNIIKFYDHVDFISKVEVSNPSKVVKGTVFYMTCDNEQCLPPKEVPFTFDLSSLESGKKKKGEALSIDNELTAVGKSGALDPVYWTTNIVKIDGNKYQLKLNAKIDDNWFIYSSKTPDGGPRPTNLLITNTQNCKLVGSVSENGSKKMTGFEPLFEMELTKFKHDAEFTQNIEISDPNKEIKGTIEFQACDDSKCINPKTLSFTVVPSTLKGLVHDQSSISKIISGDNRKNTPIDFSFNQDNANQSCYKSTDEVNASGMSLWWVFVFGFGGGLLAILTPCVFPMIPLTVSFFTKGKKAASNGLRDAIIYGISIIVIYVCLGLLITSIFGADALNQLSTNPWLNIAFCILFIVFAISFFGYFEITLPSSWVNKSDQVADKGGILGIFFMAFTLSLVSFSCTGPIIGSLLVQTVSGGGDTLFGRIPLSPLVGMFGFSLALALPFAFFAAFPTWLQALPKSGSWMNSVKVTLGFVEIALALKFLSVADLTKGWKILPYELFLVLWVLCALGLMAYYFGWIRFPHDSGQDKLSTNSKVLGFISLILAFYLGSGFMVDKTSGTFKTPNLLSGLAPPSGHSYIYPKSCPLNLECYHDFYEALKVAKERNKPILIDFTGYGCVNCRRMEDLVWSNPEIYKLIRDEYILVSLYTDDKKPLESPYISPFDGRSMTTIGNKWADFQALHFNRNSQPFYVLIAPDGKVLNKPVAYTPNVDTYKGFLQCGVEMFNKQ